MPIRSPHNPPLCHIAPFFLLKPNIASAHSLFHASLASASSFFDPGCFAVAAGCIVSDKTNPALADALTGTNSHQAGVGAYQATEKVLANASVAGVAFPITIMAGLAPEQTHNRSAVVTKNSGPSLRSLSCAQQLPRKSAFKHCGGAMFGQDNLVRRPNVSPVCGMQDTAWERWRSLTLGALRSRWTRFCAPSARQSGSPGFGHPFYTLCANFLL